MNISPPHWYWAWRWHTTKEPAIMVVSNVPLLFSSVTSIVIESDLIDNNKRVIDAHLSESEWKTWHAFELCPVIEIWRGSDWLEWRQLKP